MTKILNFKKTSSSKTKFYERTAEEDIIYLPKMQNEDLYQLFLHYFHEWHRLNCGDSCKGPEILEYCFSQSKSFKEFSKTLFYYVNQIKLVKNA
jgi:hypothetical protein